MKFDTFQDSYSLKYTIAQIRTHKELTNATIYLVLNTDSRIYFATLVPEIYPEMPYIYCRYTDCGSIKLDIDYYSEHFRVEYEYYDRLLSTIDDPA